MMEHPTKQELDEYRWRVLAPAAFLTVHRHVTACPRCATQCNSPGDLARDLQDLHEAVVTAPDDTPYHLSAEETVAYVRGSLNEIDLEIAESHLSICSTCLKEVQPGLPLMNRWQPWRVAAVVAFGLVLVLLTLWMFRTKPAQQKEEAAGAPNSSSPQDSSTAEVLPNQAAVPDGPSKTEDAKSALDLKDGNRIVTLDKQGTLAGLEQLPSPIQNKIRAALQTGRLEQSPALAQLASRPSTLLGESRNELPFRLIGPIGQLVRSKQPTLRWHALAGAQSYTVVVTDADLNEIATSPTLNTTEWRISKPLKDGRVYSWQVTALKDGVRITSPVLPAPQAKFKVIDRPTSEMLQQAASAYPNSHLTLGVLYAEAGLLDEAEKELQELVRENPRARVAQELLRNVKAMRAALP